MLKTSLSTLLILFILHTVKGQMFHVSEDFNASTIPSGWTNTAVSGTQTWLFSDNSGNNLDGTAMAFFDDDALGVSANNNTVELLTPVFDNSVFTQTTLSFDYNFRQFVQVQDSFAVEIFDGTNWIGLFSIKINDCGNWTLNSSCIGNFPHQNIDISAYANTNCQVKFRYHDGNSSNDWGWYAGIDNVIISSPFANDIGISELINPVSSCGLSSAELIQVKIRNYGLAATSTPFDVVLDVDNGTQFLTETVSSIIPAGDSIIYTFSATVNMQTIGSYVVKAYTNYSLDSGNGNDTTLMVIENTLLNLPPFYDDFEGPNSWSISGTNPSWALGTPTNTFINSAISGTKAYVTNLSGNYNSNELSYLTSPCFDLSQGNGIPILSFDLIYNTELAFDSLTLEATTNNGITWQQVTSGALSSNWYTNPGSWQGVSNGWLAVENTLDNLNGFSAVSFRFKFSSDGGVNREGIGIDNFSIRNPSPNDLDIASILYPSNATNQLCGLGLENITVEIKNDGFNTIDTTYFFYQINSGTIFQDTLITSILPNQKLNYTFQDPFNFSTVGNYTLDLWIDIPRNSDTDADSILNYSITNNTTNTASALPFEENFDGSGWVASNTLANGWSRNPSSSTGSDYQWNVSSGPTQGSNTGPNSGRGGSGKYLSVNSLRGVQSNVAELESPCISLNAINGAVLEYWYHRYGTNAVPIRLDVHNGIQWLNDVDVNNSTPQTSSSDAWAKRRVSLNQFSGRIIKVRFRTIKASFGSGDMAIDDVRIYKPIPQDAKMVEILNPIPRNNDCNSPNNTSFIVKVANEGTQTILPNTLTVNYKVNNQTTVKDTIRSAILVDDSLDFTFSISPNLTAIGQVFSIDAWTELSGDTNLSNDSIENLEIINYPIYKMPYFNNFDAFKVGLRFGDNDAISYDWSRSPDKTATTLRDYSWVVGYYNKDLEVTPNQDTPNENKYLYTLTAGATGDVALVEGPCIDLSGSTNPVLVLSSKIQANNTPRFYVDIKDGNTWNLGHYTINYRPLVNGVKQFHQDTIDLTTYANKVIKFRFRTMPKRASSGGLSATEIMIDDVLVFEKSDTDIWLRNISSPASNCNLSSAETVSIRIKNIGYNVIPPNSITASYQMGNTSVNELVSNSIPVDSVLEFSFTQTLDLSAIDSNYSITASASVLGDTNTFNNNVQQTVRNTTQNIIYSEGFEGLSDSSCFYTKHNPFNLREGWSTESSFNSDRFAWLVTNSSNCDYGFNRYATPSDSTGPDLAHSGNSFVYFEASGRNSGSLITPCFNLQGHTSVNADFWYHKYGSAMKDLIIEIDTNHSGNWFAIDSILGQTQSLFTDAWLPRSINLDAYVNKTVQLKFFARDTILPLRFRSDMAIDDFTIYSPTLTTIEDNDKNRQQLNLYPNPNIGNFNLMVSKTSLGSSYTILNLSGQKLQEGRIQEENQEIQLQNQEKGIYFLRILETGETLKFVVM